MVVYLDRRQFGAAVASMTTYLCTAGPASASTVVAMSVEELVKQSKRVALCTPVAHYSDWAEVGNGRRIVTLTRLIQREDWMLDETNNTEGEELEVLTLGGRVGDIGQRVAGEAILRLGEDSLLFLGQEAALSRRVIGMAQGQYPIDGEGDERILKRSLRIPHLVNKNAKNGVPLPKRAVDALPTLSLPQARQLVRSVR